jgi:vancomycin resistance protein YoaR
VTDPTERSPSPPSDAGVPGVSRSPEGAGTDDAGGPDVGAAGPDLSSIPGVPERSAGGTSRQRALRWLTRGLLVAAVPLAVVFVLLAAWGMDTAVVGADQSARGAVVGDRAVGGLGRDDLEARLQGMANEFSLQPVTVSTPEGDLETTAGDLGLSLDVAATADAAMDLGRTGPILARPFDWVHGIVAERPAPATYRVNQALLEFRLTPLGQVNSADAVEPTIEPTPEGWQLVAGVPGTHLDVEGLVEEIATAVRDGGNAPVEVSGRVDEVLPRFTDAEAQELADEANRLTDRELDVVVAGQNAQATDAVLRTFFEPVAEEDHLRLRVDRDRVDEWLEQKFSGLRVEPTDARFEVGFGIVVEPSSTGQACCTDDAPRQIREALEAEAEADSVDLQLTVLQPALSTEMAEGLGIVEPVASFTTEHACCQNRVANIQRMADMVRGAVILPGETFSLNGHVGQRTREKGYVEDGAIYAGVFVQDVGGGVSQFATTMFNAAFFAGLDYDEYQAHTIYISRYPRGREATISWPSPDLAVRNESPHGILVWPTYTDTSITVTLFSTKWVEADQTDQRSAALARGCTRVTTERTRRFFSEAEAARIRGGPPEADRDPLEVTDTVFAIYQPSEGVLC